MPNKAGSQIAVIGVGQVGGAAAFALTLASTASELLLVDINTTLRDGQVRDVCDAAYSCNSLTRVRAASHHEAGQCDIIIVTVGSRCTIGQTNLERTYHNISSIQNVMNAIKPIRQDALILVVSNPVDLLTSLVVRLSGLPETQVIGSGTFLDSVRLRRLLADRMGVAAKSLDIYTLGVHGESQVVAWSAATIGGVCIDKSKHPADDIDHYELERSCKDRSQSIIRAKGSIPFGISSIVLSICDSILHDKRNVLPISCFQPEHGCCFSWPVVLGRSGVVRKVEIPLDDKEEAELAETTKTFQEMVDRILPVDTCSNV